MKPRSFVTVVEIMTAENNREMRLYPRLINFTSRARQITRSRILHCQIKIRLFFLLQQQAVGDFVVVLELCADKKLQARY
jgi:hypothetical protein